MDTIYSLLKRAKELKEKSQVDSITPEEVGKLHEDTLVYIASLEQSADGLGIKKVYQSKSAMEADTDPVGTNGKTLRYGQLVSIYDDAHADSSENGNIYAFQKPGWLLMGKVSGGTTLSIAQEAGDSTTSVMSQKSVSDAIKELERKVQDSAQAAGVAVSLREKLYGKKITVTKDSGATVRTHKIVFGKWGSGLYKHLLVPIKGYEKVHLVANPTEGFEYTFLVDDENLQQTKISPTYAQNYRGEVKAKAGKDIFVDVPVDADYLYVLFYYEFYTPKNKMEPSLIELIKEGDFEGLKKGTQRAIVMASL